MPTPPTDEQIIALLADKRECLIAAYRLSKLPLLDRLDALDVLYAWLERIEEKTKKQRPLPPTAQTV